MQGAMGRPVFLRLWMTYRIVAPPPWTAVREQGPSAI